ncbi:hypothetical protein EDB92DRAFT_1817535 [Lactarius akahatsu]|uniref:Uncharacterized protein n=1 Tax=Lactarius akahatsu TaxID=416441 RepID=A0AAD4QC08_9AGAM|nr:hypothetical protein EDB92DRAFT_1817535 [Lactarius akahatsu]
MTHPPEDNVVLRWVIVEFTSDMNAHVWRKCRVGRAGDKDKVESLWQVGQLETRTREEKTREGPHQERQPGTAEPRQCEDGGRAMVIHTPIYSTIIQLKRVAGILYELSTVVPPGLAKVLTQSPVVDNGARAGRRVSSWEPKLPAQSVALVMPEAAAATHARTHARRTLRNSQRSTMSTHRCQYHEPKKSKTHAVTSGWYTDAGTRSRDEHIPNSEAALLALRNNDWTGSRGVSPACISSAQNCRTRPPHHLTTHQSGGIWPANGRERDHQHSAAVSFSLFGTRRSSLSHGVTPSFLLGCYPLGELDIDTPAAAAMVALAAGGAPKPDRRSRGALLPRQRSKRTKRIHVLGPLAYVRGGERERGTQLTCQLAVCADFEPGVSASAVSTSAQCDCHISFTGLLPVLSWVAYYVPVTS